MLKVHAPTRSAMTMVERFRIGTQPRRVHANCILAPPANAKSR